MTKKSNAQIKRMMHRASQRGEEYVAPILNVPPLDEPSNTANQQDSSKLKAVTKLNKALDSIDKDEEMRAKDRRSAKRKAEAIAIEESGVPLEDLLIWFKEHGASRQKESDVKQPTKKKEKNMDDPFQNPYIVFIGQLAFTTTKEALFAHLKEELGKEFKITPETCRIRLLTDAKTNKSRGMAFLETRSASLRVERRSLR